MKRQKGFAHVGLIIIFVVALAILAFTWYRIANTNNPGVGTNGSEAQDSSNTPTKPFFASEAAIYTNIYDSIKSTSASISVGQEDMSGGTKSFYSYSSTDPGKETVYTSGNRFTVNNKCDSSCGAELTPEGHLSSAYFIPDALFKAAFTSITDDLLTHKGIVKTTSGTAPGTYADHDYVLFSVTLQDKTTLKLETSTNVNDGGQMITATIF